jgi:YggT family protein
VARFLVQLIQAVCSLYSLAIIVRAFVSMLGMNLDNPVIRFIYDITEPVLKLFRRYTVYGMLDFSPVVALILLSIVQWILVSLVVSVFR